MDGMGWTGNPRSVTMVEVGDAGRIVKRGLDTTSRPQDEGVADRGSECFCAHMNRRHCGLGLLPIENCGNALGLRTETSVCSCSCDLCSLLLGFLEDFEAHLS